MYRSYKGVFRITLRLVDHYVMLKQLRNHPNPVRFQFFLINLYLILKVANSNYRHGFRIGLKLKEVEAFGFSTILLVNDLGRVKYLGENEEIS